MIKYCINLSKMLMSQKTKVHIILVKLEMLHFFYRFIVDISN